MNTAEQIKFLRDRISAIDLETYELHVEYAFTDEGCYMRHILLAKFNALALELDLHIATLNSLTDGNG